MAEISPEKLLEHLARGKAIGALALIGVDVYLRDLCRKKIVEAFIPGESQEWAVARLSARENGWDEVIERASTLPMFAPRQIVIVEDAQSLEKLSEERRNKVLDALEKYLASPSPLTILVLEAVSLDRRQRFFKLLREAALLVELTIGSESAATLTAEMASELGAGIDPEAASLLAEITNCEPARIRIELEKLAAYVGEGKRIEPSDVEAMVVAGRRNTVWQLADMIASRDRRAAFSFLDNLLRDGDEAIGIVAALAWMYRKLAEARELPFTTPSFQAARALEMRPDSAVAAVRNAHRLPKQKLLKDLEALAEADSQLKSSNPDPRALLEFLLAHLTSSATSVS